MVRVPTFGAPIGGVVARAPVAVLSSLVMAGGFYALALADVSPRQEDLALFVGPAAFLGAVIGHGAGNVLCAAVVALVAGTIAAFAAPLMVSLPLFFSGLTVAAVSAPLLTGGSDPIRAWWRIVRNVTAAGLAALGALIVIGGIFLGEVSAETLLGLDASDFTADFVVPAATGLLAPLVFLTLAMPEASREEDRVSDALASVAQVFARLVLTPLLAMYTLVLAAYVARIAVTGGLPSNEIGWIVPLFCASGALTYVALAGLAEPGRMSGLFLRLWFPVTLAPLTLFAIAVAVRVGDYGVTPDRYRLVLLGVLFVAMGFAFTLGGRRTDIRLIPVTTALVLMLGAIGPWSLEPTVRHSQSRMVFAAFVPGKVADALSTMESRERQRVCSHVRSLAEAGGLRQAELVLQVSDPGLLSLCLEPLSASDPADIIDLDATADVIRLPGGALVWGPLPIFPGRETVSASAADLSMDLSGTTLLVRFNDRAAAFDLTPAAQAWKAGERRGQIALSSSGITVLLPQLLMVLAGDDGGTLRHATVVVVVDPSAPAFSPAGE